MNPVWGVAILVLSVWFLLAVLSSAIALRKNRSVTRWYFLTLLFGIVPFLLILFLPPLRPVRFLPLQRIRT